MAKETAEKKSAQKKAKDHSDEKKSQNKAREHHDDKKAHQKEHHAKVKQHHDEEKAHQKEKKETSKKSLEIKATNLTPEDKKYVEKYASELSPTTTRAKWINNTSEHEDHPGQSLATRNPEVIKHWAEERKAVPATVPGTEHDDHLGVLRFNFPGYGGQNLQEVSWDQWMKTFEDRNLVFLFQEHMKNGNMSNFFHMDSPLREHD